MKFLEPIQDSFNFSTDTQGTPAGTGEPPGYAVKRFQRKYDERHCGSLWFFDLKFASQ
jgi:hypothetical protein